MSDVLLGVNDVGAASAPPTKGIIIYVARCSMMGSAVNVLKGLD